MKHSGSSQRSEQKDKILEHHFNQIKQENMNSSFPEVESWLYKAAVNIQNKEQLTNERKLHKMKNFFFANKLRLVYTIIAFVVLVAACNMPVTQTESAGQIIAFTVPAENSDFEAKMNALPWIKNAQVSQNENTGDGVKMKMFTVILQNSTEEQALQYSKELEAIGGIITIKIKPMNYDVKRPLYSAALHDFFSVDINATGMSDEELQNEMERQFKEQGVDYKFSIKTVDGGRREIRIQNENIDGSKEPKSFELRIEDDNGKENIKMMTKKADPEKFKGKSDKEIREIVRKDTGNPNLKDSDIIIERNGDDVKIKVNAERNEIK